MNQSKGQTGPLTPMFADENRYAMVHKVAKRAKQITEGTAQTAAELSNSRAIKSAIKEMAQD